MFTLLPWTSRIEAVLDAQFPRGVELKVTVDALLRGTTQGPLRSAQARHRGGLETARGGPRHRGPAADRDCSDPGGDDMTETTALSASPSTGAPPSRPTSASSAASPSPGTRRAASTRSPAGERFLAGSLTRSRQGARRPAQAVPGQPRPRHGRRSGASSRSTRAIPTACGPSGASPDTATGDADPRGGPRRAARLVQRRLPGDQDAARRRRRPRDPSRPSWAR